MVTDDHQVDASMPVEPEGEERLEDGIALCLSGGGYRAMLFHVGSFWRLNELGYLRRLKRISSVSGGSITAATLGLHWSRLDFDSRGVAKNLREEFVGPVRNLAGKTIDVGAVLTGIFTPGTVADKVTAAYRKHLFGKATLQQLPDEPRFVINSTNLQTGSLWRFSKRHMADYRVGKILSPEVELAVAVAASSAFPPVLSPLRLTLDPETFEVGSRGPLYKSPFFSEVVLSDGGVYDNLGLETAWKRCRTILVSDGGGQMQPEGEIASDWARHAIRVNSVIDNQVRNLRKRQTIAGFERKDRHGTYWGIRSDLAKYGPPPGSLNCPVELTARLAEVKTRLEDMDDVLQQRLINWGYAVTDAAMRRWVETAAQSPPGFPYAQAGIG